ncbi:MAG TPA: hypothetical protein VFB38_21940 [Chthonomonadaceae bacterium]|nr:hypothetical protein [Chthonomonadaceae bacterium]
MTKPKVYEGTPEELAAHADEFRRYPKLQLIVPPQQEADGSLYRADLAPEERVRTLDELAEMNRDLPGLPDEVFDREKLYEDVP